MVDYPAMMEIWVSTAWEEQDQHILLEKNKYLHPFSLCFFFIYAQI